MVTDKTFITFSDGIFKPYFEKFILYKRSQGNKVARSTLSRLKFLNNAFNEYDVLNVAKETVEEILSPKAEVSKFTRNVRVTLLRQFLNFISMLGVDCYQLPPKYVRQPHSAFNPYIFSDDEIVRLLRATDNMTVYRTDSKRMTEVMPIIVRILISTGMRIGEVLALNKTDIDIKTGVIKAVNCKNDVCRYIPMADTLIVSVKAYIETIENNELMFCSPKTGNSYHYNTVRQLFSKLCKTAQIFRTDGTTPNIHSLRHTFCSKSLEQLLASGMDLYTAMPILAAYVGHSHFRDTEFYIHFTETSYNDFINKQKQLRKLIPEVDDE